MLTAAEVALGLTVVAAPHLLGGAYTWATVLLSATLSAILLSVVVAGDTVEPEAWGREPLLALLFAMLAVTIAQALPLPSAWVARLAPSSWSAAVETAKGLGLTAPGGSPFSLDPGNTSDRIAFAAAVTAAFAAARVLAVLTRSTPILAVVAASTVLIALSHLSHKMLGAGTVYGLYTPHEARPSGPLLNPNNLAGFMAFGTPLCLGLGLRAQQRVERWAWWLGAGLLAATGLLAGSRAGTAVLVAGPLVFGTLHAVRERRGDRQSAPDTRERSPARRLGAGALQMAALVAAVAASAYGLAELAADDFVDTDYRDLTKLELLRTEVAALFRSPSSAWLGVGRGAFPAAFAALYTGPGRALFAECLPLQYAIEFGIPFTALLAVGATWRVTHDFFSWRSPAHLGGMVGVSVITLQNFVDFSLEMSGIAVPVAVCLAAALPQRRRKNTERGRALDLRTQAWLCTALCVGAVGLFGWRAVQADAARGEQSLVRHFQADDTREFWALFRRLAPEHPAEPAFAALAAAQSVREDGKQAPFWLNRAMNLAPGWGTPHLWAAQWLLKRGRPSQALTELALAAEPNPWETQKALCEWLAKVPSADTVLRVAPAGGAAREIILDGGARCLEAAPNEASVVDEAILRDQPQHVAALARGIRRELARHEYGSALRSARALEKVAPRTAAAYIAQADAHHGLGEPREAVTALLRGAQHADDRRGVLTSLAWARVATRDERGLRETIDQLRMEAGGNARKQAATLMLLGQCEAALGNDARALKAMREAAAFGAGADSLASAAQLATKLGQLDFARETWSQLCAQAPQHPRYCAARDELVRRLAAP